MFDTLDQAIQYLSSQALPEDRWSLANSVSHWEHLEPFGISKDFMAVAKQLPLNGIEIGCLILGDRMESELHVALTKLNGNNGVAMIPSTMCCVGSWEANALAVTRCSADQDDTAIYLIELWRGLEAKPARLAPTLRSLLIAATNHWKLRLDDCESWTPMESWLSSQDEFETDMLSTWNSLWNTGV